MPPPTLLSLVQRSAEYLQGKGIANAKREAEWIFAETLALTRMDLYLRFEMPLDEAEVARLRDLVQRRGRREPLAYVLGSQPFRGLKLLVGPGALVPRPETEELVDHVLADLPPGPCRVLDVGTGSGAIALALKNARPELVVEASDASDAALAWARRNAEALGLAVMLRRDDLAAAAQPPFQAVVANLPYIAEDERGVCDPELAFEPQDALFAPDGGLALIARLIADAPRLLAPDGVLWLEHGWTQAERIRALAAGHGLVATAIRDLAGHQRIARIAHG